MPRVEANLGRAQSQRNQTRVSLPSAGFEVGAVLSFPKFSKRFRFFPRPSVENFSRAGGKLSAEDSVHGKPCAIPGGRGFCECPHPHPC